MGQARELRDNAARCLRLSRSIDCADDIAWLQALAAEATQAADQIETDETASLAERHPSGGLVDEFGSPGAFEASNAALNGNARSAPDMFPDRRRPGRREVSSVLIPLLRKGHITGLPADPAVDGRDQLSASRGIVIWTLISALVWAPLLWWVL